MTGVHDSFTALYRAEGSYVMNTLRRLGVRSADLDDVTVDVFLVVHRHWDQYDTRRPARPWVRAFAVRTAADYRKTARFRREVPGGEDDSPDTAPGAEERMIDRDKQRLVLEALDAVDHDRREVFVLHELDECPVSEVAQVLGIPVNTAYSRLRLAREDFAAAVKRILLRRGER